MIYSATAKGPYKVPGYFDPDSKRIIGIVYKPDAWAANTVYYLRGDDDADIVIPSTFKGLYYRVANPGKSAATEPTWPTQIGAQVTDGSVVWEAVAYNLLPPTDSISTSTFSASDSVTLTGATLTGGKTQVMISTVPAGVTEFTITNHTVRSSGEEDDVSLLFRVAER